MSGKWTVRKRDGAWQAFDPEGKSRYASSDWMTVVSFALLGFHEKTLRQQMIESFRRWPPLGPWGY